MMPFILQTCTSEHKRAGLKPVVDIGVDSAPTFDEEFLSQSQLSADYPRCPNTPHVLVFARYRSQVHIDSLTAWKREYTLAGKIMLFIHLFRYY